MRASLPACLSPSAAALAHRRKAGVGRTTRGAARKAERAMMEDMVGCNWRGWSARNGLRASREQWFDVESRGRQASRLRHSEGHSGKRQADLAVRRATSKGRASTLCAPFSAITHLVHHSISLSAPQPFHSLTSSRSFPAGRHPRPSALPVFVATTRCTSRAFPPATISAL